jgi:hypothetical protein
MMKFDSFYFLHIPKTGGRGFRHRLMNDMLPIIKQNGIENINHSHLHGCWSRDIKDSTYIFTILRDPVKRTVSHYFHLVDYLESINRRNILEPSTEGLIKWVKQNESGVRNFQSKNFLYDNTDQSFILYNDTFKNVNFDFDLVLERLNRVNFVVKLEEFDSNVDFISNKIMSDLGINEKIKENTYETFPSSDPESVYRDLSDEQMNYIKSLLDFDYKLYSSVKDL